MRRDHPVFGDEEEVVEEMLVPDRSVGGWETAQAAREQVHVEEGYLGPGVERRCESECWERKGQIFVHHTKGSQARRQGLDVLSNHHPVPTPRSSPPLVLGTSTFFSCACGIV